MIRLSFLQTIIGHGFPFTSHFNARDFPQITVSSDSGRKISGLACLAVEQDENIP
jgi:hypothetical protein